MSLCTAAIIVLTVIVLILLGIFWFVLGLLERIDRDGELLRAELRRVRRRTPFP